MHFGQALEHGAHTVGSTVPFYVSEIIPLLENVYKFFLKDTHINSYIAIQRIGSLKHFDFRGPMFIFEFRYFLIQTEFNP